MPRNDHHCPGLSGPVDGYPGNCRWSNFGVRHCETHMNFCMSHRLAYMKSKTCVACDKSVEIRYFLHKSISPMRTPQERRMLIRGRSRRDRDHDRSTDGDKDEDESSGPRSASKSVGSGSSRKRGRNSKSSGSSSVDTTPKRRKRTEKGGKRKKKNKKPIRECGHTAAEFDDGERRVAPMSGFPPYFTRCERKQPSTTYSGEGSSDFVNMKGLGNLVIAM